MDGTANGVGELDREYAAGVAREIAAWRGASPGILANAVGAAAAQLSRTVEWLVPETAVRRVLEGADWGARRLAARVTTHGNNLRGCDRDAAEAVSRYVALGAAEGGVAGMAGLFALPFDVPALIVLALTMVRRVGAEYGFDPASGTEADRQFVLAVLAASGANTAAEKADAVAAATALASGDAVPPGRGAVAVGIRTLARQLGVNLTRRKILGAVPVVGAAVGAAANAWFLSEAGQAARQMFRERWLRERGWVADPGTGGLVPPAAAPGDEAGAEAGTEAGTAAVRDSGEVPMDVGTSGGAGTGDARGAAGTGNSLKQLEARGQSPWLDFIQRSFTADGLQELIDRDGLKGITSNPAIFEKAMGAGTDYDEGFKQLAEAGDKDALDIYEALAIEDIQQAADMMRPVWEATNKVDGYVSLEVSPYLALHTDETVAEARRLWKAVGRENLMVKVPGTDKGVAAIRTLISEGLNINVTLLFAMEAYQAVAEAFLAGLEDRAAKGESIAGISSVASFFVSRIDSVIDKKIDERVKNGEDGLKALRGKVAIANAKLAYAWYGDMVKSERWAKLAAQGALPQRLLWASTGVKDKAYSDVMYVEELIGPDTVDTIPPATMDAFRDHGTVAATLTEGLDEARRVLDEAEKAGLDLPGVTEALVTDGVKLFAEAADKLLGAVADKRVKMLGDRVLNLELGIPDALKDGTKAAYEDWRESGRLRDLWAGDAGVWTGGDEAKWLGWLRVVDDRTADLPRLQAFADEVKEAGFTHVLLLGMGGSSLGPEVLAKTFGKQAGYPELLVLDSTDPQQVEHFAEKVDFARTLFIVSSKSGSTLEPNILKAYFFDRVVKAVGKEKAGAHFVAVTDPGSKVEGVAAADGFRQVFAGDPTIGGRYSVLSNFGLVPAAAMGLDLPAFLKSTALMVRSCAAGTPPKSNPGVQLGILLGTACKAGRDKVTVLAGPGLEPVGAWLEQLLAESTGKNGHGIVPVDGEPTGAPGVYGSDRVFAYLTLAGQPGDDAAVQALEAAGHPVVRLVLADPMQVGQVFFLWEFATAVAGSVIGIDPFDQPDVEASKVETRKLTEAYARDGSLPAEAPFAEAEGIRFFTDDANAKALPKEGGVDAIVKAQLDRAGPGDYVALLAYVERNAANADALTAMRTVIRDGKHVATCAGFGPRFLHSTGQTYKGGPNSGVFLQVTADDAADVEVPGEKFSFGVVKAAQARGDFAVLAERGRRALRVHLGSDVAAGLERLARAVRNAAGGGGK